MTTTARSHPLQLPVQSSEMYGAFGPDRSRLLTGGDGSVPKVHIWEVDTGNCLQVLTGHKGPVAALAWTEDQRRVARAPSMDALAFGMCARASAFACWMDIGSMSVRWSSASRGSNYFLEAGTDLCGSGSCPAESRVKYSRVTQTASTMPFSTRVKIECYQAAATVPLESGRSRRDVA